MALPTLGFKRSDATSKSSRGSREVQFRRTFITDIKDTASTVKFILKTGSITILKNTDDVLMLCCE